MTKDEKIRAAMAGRIRFVRELKGLTKEYVAEKINVSLDVWESIEAGKHELSLNHLCDFCKLLDISPGVIGENIHEDEEIAFWNAEPEGIDTENLSPIGKKVLQIIYHTLLSRDSFKN